MKMKPVYKASDDSEHPTQKAAEHREKLLKAAKELVEACKKVSKLLAGAALTGDGQEFDPSLSAHYWIVQEPYGRMPFFRDVYLYPYSMEVDLDRDDGTIILREWQQPDRGEGRYVTYKVSELYSTKKAAMEAYIEACDKWLADCKMSVDQVKGEAIKA